MGRSQLKWKHLLPALGLPYVMAMGAGVAGAATSGDVGGVKQAYAFHDVNVLGTSMDMQVATASAADAEKAHGVVLGEIERLRKILSTYDAGSEISQVNAGTTPVRVSRELIEVLREYETWQQRTKGIYSAGLGGAVVIWKDAEKTGRAPSAAALAGLAAKLKQPLWRIDEAAQTVQRLTDEAINVDSLGKGYIAERAANLARARVVSVRGVLVNIGGDITALGSSTVAGYTPWRVAVADPAHPEDGAAPLLELRVSAAAVATSGNYARGFEVGGKRYSHVIDPRTAAPVDFAAGAAPGVVSATVIASDNAAANAVATSLCVLHPAEGLALAREHGAECLLVLADGTQKRSAGFDRYVMANAEAAGAAPSVERTATPKMVNADHADDGAGGFARGYEVSIPLELKAAKHHAYCAVWVETEKGEYVKTVMIWGNEMKYIRHVDAWWRQVQGNRAVVATATRATRAAGKYPLTWDGTDDKGKRVPPGKYKIMVETAVWKDPPTQKGSAVIDCGAEKSTATIQETKHFGELTLSYGPRGQ